MSRFWPAIVGAVVLAAACSEADVYVYTARKYEADAACLDAYGSVETVHGSGVSATCPRTCFQLGDDIYTSQVCPPLPDDAVELSPEAGACVAANALYAVTCGLAEGGFADAGAEAAALPAVLDAGDGGG